MKFRLDYIVNVLWKLRDKIKKKIINGNSKFQSPFQSSCDFSFLSFFFSLEGLYNANVSLSLFFRSVSLSLVLSLVFFFFFFFPYILSAFRFVWLMSYLTELLVQRNRKQERHTASWLISISTGPKRRQGFVVVSSKINHRSFRPDPNFFPPFCSFFLIFHSQCPNNNYYKNLKKLSHIDIINLLEEKKIDKIYDFQTEYY